VPAEPSRTQQGVAFHVAVLGERRAFAHEHLHPVPVPVEKRSLLADDLLHASDHGRAGIMDQGDVQALHGRLFLPDILQVRTRKTWGPAPPKWLTT